MNGKAIAIKPCECGGRAARAEQGKALGLRCVKCGRETSKTESRSEAALDALAEEWNSPQPGQTESKR